MTPYTVATRPRVRRSLRQLDAAARKDVLATMRALATDPRPPGTKPLKGTGRICGCVPATTG